MAEEKGQDENLPVLMRHKQRCIALLDKFFGETADEEFFQTTPRLYPEHDEVGPFAFGPKEVVKDVFDLSFGGAA